MSALGQKQTPIFTQKWSAVSIDDWSLSGMLADLHTPGITSRFNVMNKKMLEYIRHLVVLMVVACLTAALSVSDVVAQKPDFAGKAAEKGGRSDEAKEHAKERGKGGKRGLDKETEGKDKDHEADDKNAKKDKKARKDRRARRIKN